MSESPPVALQLCPFSEYLETALRQRFDVVRWYTLDATAQAAWLAAQAPTVRAVVTGGHIGCSNELMAQLPQLGIISINGVGVDKVDLPFARGRGVRVTTTPGVLTEDVADLAVGLVIALLRNLPAADQHVRGGHWPQGELPLGRKVSGRRFGIVGLGQIGSAIAARLAPFGPVSYMGPAAKPVPYPYHGDVLSLAKVSDVLVLACPANEVTRHLVGRTVLEALGPKGYLVNVSRGSVVDEAALVEALDAGQLAGAALDVYAQEPQVPAGLRTSARVVLTPHIASATWETRVGMADTVLANLDAWRAGRPLPSARV